MMNKLSNSTFLIPAMVIIAILAAGSGFYISLKHAQKPVQTKPNIEGLFWPNPKQIHKFSTLDQTGAPFGIEQIQDKWSFVFFGYIHCPDICPITMAVMGDVYKELSESHNDIQTIFVSVDPERDSTEKLLQYVAYFNDKFIGLGGSTDMVNSLTKQLGVAYYLNNEEGGNYLVDHSASIFLIDPQGRMVGKISPPHQKSKIIQQFTQIKSFVMDNS